MASKMLWVLPHVGCGHFSVQTQLRSLIGHVDPQGFLFSGAADALRCFSFLKDASRDLGVGVSGTCWPPLRLRVPHFRKFKLRKQGHSSDQPGERWRPGPRSSLGQPSLATGIAPRKMRRLRKSALHPCLPLAPGAQSLLVPQSRTAVWPQAPGSMSAMQSHWGPRGVRGTPTCPDYSAEKQASPGTRRVLGLSVPSFVPCR